MLWSEIEQVVLRQQRLSPAKTVSIPESTTLEWSVLERSVLQRFSEMTFVAMGDQLKLKLDRR